MAAKLDLWLTGFAVLMLAGASSSYRERALLSFESDIDSGLLGREFQELDLSEAGALNGSSGVQFLPRLIRDAMGTSGSRRRNIPALASGRPLTSSPDGSPTFDNTALATLDAVPDSGSQLTVVEPATGGAVGSGPGQVGGIMGGGSGPSFGGGGGPLTTTVSLLDPENPPITPDPGMPLIPPVVSPVPEPSAWIMFILGLFFTGAVLRRRGMSSDLHLSV